MRALWWKGGTVEFIDQRLLPGRLDFFIASSTEEMCFAIRDMVVRGAPAIGAAAAYGMAQAAIQGNDMEEAADALRATRPTAYDLFYAIDYFLGKCGGARAPLEIAEEYVDSIVEKCRQIGEAGETLIKDGAKVLTHCNAGALATVDWGTALAPMRMARRAGKKMFVYVDETRPRLQGAKLTAWELRQEGIDCAIIATMLLATT
jgi:translation initiation factor eIF-2B subunit alpha/methylthioribose-1-phosphate isomerase